jgi:hypothetical protein
LFGLLIAMLFMQEAIKVRGILIFYLPIHLICLAKFDYCSS